MKKEYVMGNGAIALGALSAGVNLVTGYPGTPSSEILENIQKYSDGSVHIEWSVNEKNQPWKWQQVHPIPEHVHWLR